MEIDLEGLCEHLWEDQSYGLFNQFMGWIRKTFWPEKLSSYVLMIAVGFAGVDKWLSLMSNDDCSDFGVWWCAAWQFDSSLSACP